MLSPPSFRWNSLTRHSSLMRVMTVTPYLRSGSTCPSWPFLTAPTTTKKVQWRQASVPLLISLWFFWVYRVIKIWCFEMTLLCVSTLKMCPFYLAVIPVILVWTVSALLYPALPLPSVNSAVWNSVTMPAWPLQDPFGLIGSQCKLNPMWDGPDLSFKASSWCHRTIEVTLKQQVQQ